MNITSITCRELIHYNNHQTLQTLQHYISHHYYSLTSGCLQLLEILEISWNLKFLLEILEISWIFVDAPGKIYNQQCNFCTLRRPVIVS